MRDNKELIEILLKGLISWNGNDYGLCLIIDRLFWEFKITHFENKKLKEILYNNKPQGVSGIGVFWWYKKDKEIRVEFLTNLIMKYETSSGVLQNVD